MKTFNEHEVLLADGDAFVAGYTSLLALMRTRATRFHDTTPVRISELWFDAVLVRAASYTNGLGSCFQRKHMQGLVLDTNSITIDTTRDGDREVNLTDLTTADFVDLCSMMLASLDIDPNHTPYERPPALLPWFDVVPADRTNLLAAYSKLYHVLRDIPHNVVQHVQDFEHIFPSLAHVQCRFESTGISGHMPIIRVNPPHFDRGPELNIFLEKMSTAEVLAVYTQLFQTVFSAARNQAFWISAATLAQELQVPLPESFTKSLADTAVPG